MDSFFNEVSAVFEEIWPGLLLVLIFYLGWHFHFLNQIGYLIGVIILGWLAWKLWVHYVEQDFISGIDFVLLEIVPPREVLRSPKAMELFISNALYHFSFKGGAEQYWQGAVWFWFSLEIVSIEGQVHFYIRTPTRIRNLIETQMYAQYPQAQVKVAEDYTLSIDEISPTSAWNGWGCEFKLLKPEAYPIKTYTDYGLDKDPKEEFKVDPISPLVEFFGACGKGEQMWFQIIITPSKKEYHTKGTWFKHHNWVEQVDVELEKLQEPYISTRQSAADPKYGATKFGIEIRTPTHLQDTVKSMVGKREKLGFDTGIRIMYVAKKEIMPNGTRTNNSRDIRLILRQYADPDGNEFSRINSTQGDAMSLTGFFGISTKQVMVLANRMLEEYRERAFFHLPLRHHLFSVHTIKFPLRSLIMPFFVPYFHHQDFVLNTEELATIWHFPGQILKVPTLTRIESKEASPPPDLPT